MWEVEYTDEFGEWWDTLSEKEQIDIAACVGLLEEYGLILSFLTHQEFKTQSTHTCEN